jgi:hypothetical protein
MRVTGCLPFWHWQRKLWTKGEGREQANFAPGFPGNFSVGIGGSGCTK